VGKRSKRTLVSIDFEYRDHPYKFLGGGWAAWTPVGGQVQTGTFDTYRDVIKYLKSRRNTCIYSHNGAKAEHLILIPTFMRDRSYKSGSLIGGRPKQFFAGGNEYVDSAWLIPAAIGRNKDDDPPGIAEALGMTKKRLDYEHIEDEPHVKRCEAAANHAEIALRGVLGFAELIDLPPNDLPLSAGGAGKRVLARYVSLDEPRLKGQLLDIVRRCVYGGRSELVFKGPVPDVALLDINSSYPNAAAKGTLPHGMPAWCEDYDRCDLVEVLVNIPRCKYPPLPFRYQKPTVDRRTGKSRVVDPYKGTLFFPVGPVRGWYDREEVDYAISCGAKLLQFYGGLTHYKYFDPGPMFREFYARRVEGGLPALFVKIMSNAIIGKWQEYKEPELLLRRGDRWKIWKPKPDPKKKRKNLYAAAARTLGRARVHLHGFLEQFHALDMDTDGFKTTIEPPAELLGKGLGELKVERRGSYEGKAVKLYKHGDTLKLKGVSKRTGNLLEIWENGGGQVQRIASIREILCNKTNSLIISRPYKWRYEREKRRFFDDGTSEPFTVAEIEAGQYEWPLERRKWQDLRDRAVKADATERAAALLSAQDVPGADLLGQAYEVQVGPRGGLWGFSELPGWHQSRRKIPDALRGPIELRGRKVILGWYSPYKNRNTTIY